LKLLFAPTIIETKVSSSSIAIRFIPISCIQVYLLFIFDFMIEGVTAFVAIIASY